MLSASGDWQSMYVAFIYDDCRMLYSLLMEAKLKFANDDSDGSVICHEYLDRLKIIRLLLSNNCPFVPSIDELKMPAVRRHVLNYYNCNSDKLIH